MSTDSQNAPELREDIPLKGSADSNRCCGGGPRFILGCFAALSAGITLALLTQIYYGDYEVVPHGSVSSSAALCSRAGTDALKAGGRALDAAAAAALCLAVLAPHRTSLDASGSLLYWEYRTSHTQPPQLVEWGGPPPSNVTGRPPRLLVALSSLHAKFGVLPWARVLQPAIDLARTGFPVSEGLSAAEVELKEVAEAPGTIRKEPLLADYLEKLQANTSAELSSLWGATLSMVVPHDTSTATWRLYAGGAGAAVAGSALAAGLEHPMPDPDLAFAKA